MKRPPRDVNEGIFNKVQYFFRIVYVSVLIMVPGLPYGITI